ncbi:MAG: tetratricopeptide repeat protein [Planctomycetota bacterium]
MLITIAFAMTLQDARDDAFARGESLRLSGRLVEARAELTRALAQRPADAQVLESLGVVELMLGELEPALPRLQQAARVSPNVADHHYNLGIALAQLQRYGDALEEFRRTIAIAPEHAAAHHNLAHTLINQGALEEALHELEQAVALESSFAESHYLIALALTQMPRDPRRIARAKHEIETALALDPQHAGALHVRGLIELRAGDVAAAITALRAAVSIKPDWAEPYYALGTALAVIGARERAMKTLEFFADLERFQRSLKNIDRLIELNCAAGITRASRSCSGERGR